MNELLQRHGCANVFSIPEGLKELMSDISREVLRAQPPMLYDFIANYLSALLITREHGLLAVKILDDLCDCRPTVSEHLLQIGIEEEEVDVMSEVIKTEIEGFEPEEGKEKVRETEILKRILAKAVLDEEMSAKVCQVVRNAYRDYWYRKTMLQKNLKMEPEEPWEIAAQHTLNIYKRTKPSMSELIRATERIQASYRGYHVRKNLLTHLKPNIILTPGPEVELPGPPIDIADSREIDLGPLVTIQIKEDNVQAMLDDDTHQQLGLKYDPMKTITHVEDEEFLTQDQDSAKTPRPSAAASRKSSHFEMEGKASRLLSTRLSVLPERATEDSDERLATGGSYRNRGISFGAVPSEEIVEIIPDAVADDDAMLQDSDDDAMLQEPDDDMLEDITEDLEFYDDAEESNASAPEEIVQDGDTTDAEEA